MTGTTAWLLVLALAVSTAAVKAAGPVLLGGSALPPRTQGVIALLPPVLLAALVVVSVLSEGQRLQVDASAAGVAVAGVLLWRRAPLVVAVLVAVAVTAGLRALT